MLLQSSVPSTVEAALSFNSSHVKETLIFEWVNAETRQCCINGNELPHDCSEILTTTAVCETSISSFICKRRKLQKNAVVIFPLEVEDNIVPVFGAKNDHSDTRVEDAMDDGTGAPNVSTEKSVGEFNGGNATAGDPQRFSGLPCSDVRFCNKQDGDVKANFGRYGKVLRSDCSSWEPDMQVSSTVKLNDVKELKDNLNHYNQGSKVSNEEFVLKDLCISILRSHGLLEIVSPESRVGSTEVMGIGGDSGYTVPCKQCNQSDNTLNMLICDRCEVAFHVSCCKPRMKMLPVDEWFCHSCSKVNCNTSEESLFSKSYSTRRNAASRFRLDPILYMLKLPEPYTSKVRIGEAFQAKVPDWCDQISNDVDCGGEASEMDTSETVDIHASLTIKSAEQKSISNWLQCREVQYGDSRNCVKRIICGKWRRAPLSEVQTDDWDCSCAVRWDPTHSDCAVPQELETEQVLLHLKYIQKKLKRGNLNHAIKNRRGPKVNVTIHIRVQKEQFRNITGIDMGLFFFFLKAPHL